MREVVSIRSDGSREVKQYCDDESLTQQHFAEDCDIDKIVSRYKRAGIDIDKLNGYLDLTGASFDDVSEVPSYQDCMEVVINAENAFMMLPAHIRKQFDNDPGQFLDFANDPANTEAMIQMGLSEKPVVGGTTTPVSEAVEAVAPLPT